MSDADILFEVRGGLGLVTLNRPQALNALTHQMALRLERQLDLWRGDDAVTVVAIRGAGEKAFCAGGDIRALYDGGRPGGAQGRENFQFYADEYRLNTKIKRYPKPYIALMDGIVMGGGVGVSIHGARRIAGDRTVFAMPETGIGLFPDVGGTWFLPRLPDQIGLFAGLTGARFKTHDAVGAGICDLYIPTDRHEQAVDALAALEIGAREPLDAIDWALESLARAPEGPSPVLDHREKIAALFAGSSVADVLAALEADGSDWAATQAKVIRTKSPTCTEIAFRQIRAGAALSFEDCMRLEFRLARFCMMHGDFYEGVRAVIIDKDNAPNWSPPTFDSVDPEAVAGAFTALESEELKL